MGTAAKMGLLLFGALLVLGIVGAGAAVAAYSQLSKGLPPAQNLETIVLPEQSIVWDREHEVELARFGEFNREVVAFEDIPPVLIDATTAIEDASFWENAGFDPIGIAAAGIDSLRGRPRGASTITQQLVRQRLLTNGQHGRDRAVREPQAERDHPVDPRHPGVRGRGRQAADHGGLPQSELLRQRVVRHRRGRQGLLRQGRSRT